MPAVEASRGLFSVCNEQRGHGAHLRLSGELDIATSPVLEGWLEAVESNGNTAIVLDLDRLTFIDSSGLESILRAAQRASRSGRDFAVLKANAAVRRVFQVTRTTYLLGWRRSAHLSSPTQGGINATAGDTAR